VVANLFSKRLAEAWGQLVVHCDWYYPKLGCTIKYGQGQGMGTNGSFDVATLTDHLFINYVIDKQTSWAGVFPNNQCYGKVGDDLWIYDPEDQIRIFYEKINLPINYSKSKEYVDGNSVTEFCARTFLNGDDVSRISPNIISHSKDFRYIPTLLGLCSSRGIQLDASSFKTLNNTVKGTEVTYLTKLQDWIVGLLIIGQYEHSPYFSELTIDYLADGNWLTGDLVKDLLQDAKLLCRLMVAYAVDTILENKEAVEDKIFEIVDAMDDHGDEITQLVEPDSNLFDPGNPKFALMTKALGSDVITPKQIIVFGRYKDQKLSLNNDLIEANEEAYNSGDPKDILNYSRQLAKIAHKSCYDCGNIRYDTDRVISTQYRISKILERMDKDYTILSVKQPDQLRSLWQDLPYDTIAEKFPGYLPTLSVDD
jgi:predicted nucleic-acid-binding Zn-ribbon protein